MNMITIFKKPKKVTAKLIYSPVYSDKILGAMYRKGDFLPHAKIVRILIKNDDFLVGTVIKSETTLFFVASHSDVIDHIKSEGAAPLVESEYLRFFKNKKRMNEFIKTEKKPFEVRVIS